MNLGGSALVRQGSYLFAIRVGRGALMRVRKPKNRAGEPLGTGGCICFDRARDMWMWSDETPGGTSSGGQVRGFWVTFSGCFSDKKPLTELASELLKPCLTFPKENIF
jgi:hypothetical protein